MTSYKSSVVDDTTIQYFDAIRNNSSLELIEILRTSKENYWEFRDEENFSGKYFILFNSLIYFNKVLNIY